MDLEPTTTAGGTLIDLMDAGGPIMYVLAALSVVATAIVLAKLLRFALRGSGPGRQTRAALDAWEAGRGEEALRLLEGDRSPAAPALARAVAGRLSGDVLESRLREEASRLAQRELDGVGSGLKTLALVATVSPLLGLLGTVIGMIDAFRAMEAAGNQVDPSILSGGIWVALLTTAAGLVVAIPAAAAHGLLEAHADRAARAFEDALTRVFTRGPAASHPRARLAAE